jgi:hypothetical protein
MKLPESYNICIIRPNGYIWSSVFHELAELISYSLHDLGFHAHIVQNEINIRAANILIGVHLLPLQAIEKIPSNSIVFNTEQLGVGPKRWNNKVLEFIKKFDSWDYSERNILKFQNIGIRSPKLFKIAYHAKLNRIPVDQAKDIDVLFYGGLNTARAKILDGLKERGLHVKHLSGIFGAERDAYIARSKIVLNLHQYDTKILEMIRIHYLMNNSKVVLTQYDDDSVGGEAYKAGLVLAPYAQLVDRAVALLQSPDELKFYEEASLATLQKIKASDAMRDTLIATFQST